VVTVRLAIRQGPPVYEARFGRHGPDRLVPGPLPLLGIERKAPRKFPDALSLKPGPAPPVQLIQANERRLRITLVLLVTPRDTRRMFMTRDHLLAATFQWALSGMTII
jgi:hypothetical protein